MRRRRSVQCPAVLISRLTPVSCVLAGALLLAACGSSSKSSASASSPSSSSAATTTSSAGAAACTPSTLKLHGSGVLTVATDSPAYPPYFENNKPANGKGFESAVAYAVAAKLGFPPSQVKWVVEPFDSSYAPGPEVV